MTTPTPTPTCTRCGQALTAPIYDPEGAAAAECGDVGGGRWRL